MSILICSLLGDSSAYKDPRGNGTNIRFNYSTVNIEYILYLHKLISDLGYCSPKLPVARTRPVVNYYSSKTLKLIV
jgi:ubiquinol-cytochrome c reductase cytochrome b subunit